MVERALSFARASADEARDVARLRCAAADALTEQHGRGHWSSHPSDRSVLLDLKRGAAVLIARAGDDIVATLTLDTRKPWAIDTKYFPECTRALYLTQMAVAPERQRTGVGRACIREACAWASRWPADTIRLDAYDGPAGAGGFYAACGFREVARVTYRTTPLVYLELALQAR